MSIRTTITLDDDLVARLKLESQKRGVSFKNLVNEVIRKGLEPSKATPKKKFKIDSQALGIYAGLNYDKVGELIEYAEGPFWR